MTTDTTAPDLSDVQSGLEGVVAFATEIAEPDKAGGALRYRGVDIEDLVGVVPFEQVWGLLVDESPEPGLPPSPDYAARDLTGQTPSDLQTVTARLGGEWGLQKLIDISDDEAKEDLRRISATMISVTTPLAGDGTSVSTLSVEISSSDSSASMGSPSCLSHFVIVPSETETPIWGMTTSIALVVAISTPLPP